MKIELDTESKTIATDLYFAIALMLQAYEARAGHHPYLAGCFRDVLSATNRLLDAFKTYKTHG